MSRPWSPTLPEPGYRAGLEEESDRVQFDKALAATMASRPAPHRFWIPRCASLRADRSGVEASGLLVTWWCDAPVRLPDRKDHVKLKGVTTSEESRR